MSITEYGLQMRHNSLANDQTNVKGCINTDFNEFDLFPYEVKEHQYFNASIDKKNLTSTL